MTEFSELDESMMMLNNATLWKTKHQLVVFIKGLGREHQQKNNNNNSRKRRASCTKERGREQGQKRRRLMVRMLVEDWGKEQKKTKTKTQFNAAERHRLV